MNLNFGGSILGLIVLILNVFAIIKIVQSGASAGEKLLWVVIILLLPLIGLIIWFLMGPGGKRM